MKKQALTLALLLALALAGRGQYESFFGNESWEYNVVYYYTCYTSDYIPDALGPCTKTVPFKFNRGDTFYIGNNQYYFFHLDYHPQIFLREDTVNGRLYARYSSNEEDEEYLICDMSLTEGDTFVLYNWALHDYYYFNWDKIFIVDSVRYPMGKKVIYFSWINAGGSEGLYHNNSSYNITMRFMEGVGPIYGVCPPFVIPFCAEPYFGALLCLHKDDTLCYMTHETLGCDQTCANVQSRSNPQIRIYLNPATQYITIESDMGEELSGKVIIRDVVGRVWWQQNVSGQIVHIPVAVLPKGVYLITLFNKKQNTLTKKIVK